jgi:hypothetical protein
VCRLCLHRGRRKAACSAKTYLTYQTAQHHIPEDHNVKTCGLGSFHGTKCCIVDRYCCCVVDTLFFFWQDCGIHCYVSHTPSVNHSMFTVFLVSRPGMVALGVYHASHVCGNVCTIAALCYSWLESAEHLRTVMRVSE